MDLEVVVISCLVDGDNLLCYTFWIHRIAHQSLYPLIILQDHSK